MAGSGLKVSFGSNIHDVSKVPQVGFQLYSGNTDEGLKGRRAHGWVAKIHLRNSWPSKLEISAVEPVKKYFCYQ